MSDAARTVTEFAGVDLSPQAKAARLLRFLGPAPEESASAGHGSNDPAAGHADGNLTDPQRSGSRPPEPTTPEKVVALRDVLVAEDIPYAFGGVVALDFYREPCAPINPIDINIFLPPERAGEIAPVLETVFASDTDRMAQDAARRGLTRLSWGATHVDLFFAVTELHDSMARRAHLEPYLGTEINIISADDLILLKVLLDLPDTWRDAEALVVSERVAPDRTYIESALGLFVDPTAPRFERWRRLAAA